MKKRVIIISLAVLALLGAYFALTKLGTDEKEGEVPQSNSVSIFKTEKENIASITISTPDFNYSFYKDGDNWKVSGMEDVRLNNVRVDNLAYDFASINAETTIENTADLSAYGFDVPAGKLQNE